MGGLLALGALGAGAAGGAAATGAATAAGLGGLAGAGALGAGAAGAGAAGLAGGATAAGLGAGTAAGLGAGAAGLGAGAVGAAGLGTTAAGLGAGGTLAGLGAGATTAGLAVPALATAAPTAAGIGTGLATPALGAAATGAELGGLATGGLASSIGPGLGSAAAVGSELSKALIAAQTTAAGTAAQSAGIGTGLVGAAPQAATGLATIPQVSPAISGAVNPALSGMATKGALGTGLTSQGAMGTGLGSQGVMGAGQASTAASQLNAVAPTTSFSNTLSQAPQVFEGTLGKGLSTITPQAQAAQNISTQQLIAGAKSIYPNNPVMGKVATAQSMLESGLPGKGSGLATQGNNLFGIKGSGTAGSMNMPTKEFVGGRMVSQNAAFAKNASLSDSFAQHAKLMGNSRYSGVMNASNTQQATQALQKAGYATDPNYAGKLNSIIERIGPQYDKAAGISPQSMNTPTTNLTMNDRALGSYNTVRSAPSTPNLQDITYPNKYVSQVSNLPGQGIQPQTTFLPKDWSPGAVKQSFETPVNSFQAQGGQVGFEPVKFSGQGQGLNLVPQYKPLPQGLQPAGRGFVTDLPEGTVPTNVAHEGMLNPATGHLPVSQSGQPIAEIPAPVQQAQPTIQDVARYGRFDLYKGDVVPSKDYAPGLSQFPTRPNAPVYSQGQITGSMPQQAVSSTQRAVQFQSPSPMNVNQLEQLNTPESQQQLFTQMTEGGQGTGGINPNPPGFDPNMHMRLFGKTFDKRDVQELGALGVAGSGKFLGTYVGAKIRGNKGGDIGPEGEENQKDGYYYQDTGNFNDSYGQYYDFDEQ